MPFNPSKAIIFACSVISCVFTQVSLASSNYFQEEKIAQSLIKSEKKENIVWLKTSEKREILALLSPSNSLNLQGGVIILADLHQSPDWPVIIHGLRLHLPNFGWETLSVQLPIPVGAPTLPELDDLYKLTEERINAAILYFKNKNISNINLIGLGQSANFGLKYAASLPEESDDIQAIVSIRAYDSDWMNSSELLRKVAFPLLDIYPEHDSDIVLNSAKKRLIETGFAAKLKTRPRSIDLSAKVQNLAINKTGNLRYRQKVINGANYQFDALEPTVYKVIRGWLGLYAAGSKVTVN